MVDGSWAVKSEVIEVETDGVVVKRDLRKSMGDLSALEKSVQKFGLLHPLILDRDNVLISGRRRLEACRRAGIATVRAVKIDTTYDSMTALDVLSDENLCRRALTGDELEKLIRSKKSVLTGKGPGVTGVFSRMKKVFSGR